MREADKQLLHERVRFHVFKGKFPPRRARNIFEEAYGLWSGLYSETFAALDGLSFLPSDEFFRQDEKAVLTFDGSVIAYVAIDWMDLTLSSHFDHSYFKPFPPQTAERLTELGLRVVASVSNLCVHPNWRRGPSGQFAKETICTLGFWRGKHSRADGCLSITRNNRNMNKLCFSIGCECLARVSAHGEDADVVYAPSSAIKNHPDPNISDLVTSLWANAIVHSADGPDSRSERAFQAAVG